MDDGFLESPAAPESFRALMLAPAVKPGRKVPQWHDGPSAKEGPDALEREDALVKDCLRDPAKIRFLIRERDRLREREGKLHATIAELLQLSMR